MLETETARIIPRHVWEAGAALEVQGSGDGREQAIPMMIGYGASNHLEIMIEPVPYTAILPSSGRHARGAGDLEGTVTWRFNDETGHLPSLALAGEVKFPTAKDPLIGTGRADYTTWAIASKRAGAVDLHANAGYTISGSPPGVQLRNVWSGAAAAVLAPGANELFAEVLATTSAAPPGENGDVAPAGGTVPAEAAGSEVVGTIGAGRHLSPAFFLFGSVSRDNTNATLLRVGTTILFR